MIFYDYLLNIDVSIYQNQKKERGLLESLVIRLEDAKKLLSILYSNKEEFNNAEDYLIDWFEK
jgi:hypothetical protein